MEYKVFKRKNIIFLEKKYREALKDILDLMVRDFLKISDVDFEYQDMMILKTIENLKLKPIEVKELLFDVLENNTNGIHLDPYAQLRTEVVCFRLDDYYFSITRRHSVRDGNYAYVSLCPYPPKNYTSVIELDTKK